MIDWATYDPHDRSEPITEEMLQTHHEVSERLDFVTDILERYRPTFQQMALVKVEVQGKTVYCKLERHWRGGDVDYEDAEFPSLYLMMPTNEIEAAEQVLKEHREAVERNTKAHEEANRLAQKRAELARLKKELGEA